MRWTGRAGRRATTGVLAAVVALAALTACVAVPVAEPEEEPTRSSTPRPTPTATPTPTPTPEPPPEPEPEPEPEYTSTISEITPELATRMTASWREGCPVPLEDLRYLTMTHVDFAGEVQTGEMVVNAEVAESVTRVFGELFAQGFPIEQMRLVDDYDAEVTASLRANNTSSFNCRKILVGNAWSEHAYGLAIDINPVQNPYVLDDYVEPPAGEDHVVRAAGPGVIMPDDAVVQAFAAEGWAWGGLWGPRGWALDYMHFAVNDR